MKVSLHPGARRDIEQAAAFYERESSSALAARFVAEFRRVTELVIQHPDIGSPRARGRRGLAMGVFPYTVIYVARDDEIRIMVVKHDRKHPGFGESRR